MPIFDEIGKVLNTAKQDVTEGTKKLTETNRLNNDIQNKEAELNQHLLTLGKEYYIQFRATSEHESIPEVKRLRKELKTLKDDLLILKGKQRCPECGTENQNSVPFCPNCGTKQALPPKVIDESGLPLS